MKKVLITGGDGFIGKNLTAELLKKQIEVINFSRKNNLNVINKKNWEQQPPVDTVFHLAAVSGYKECNDNLSLAYKVNVSGTVNALDYCRQSKAKLIFPSTYVYAAPYTDKKKETDPIKPATHYAFTKRLGEEICLMYSRIFKVNTLILRTGNIYGPGQKNIYIVPKLFEAMENNQGLILTKPEVERSFIYIADLIQAYIKLAEADTLPGDIYNIGPDQATQLTDLIKTIESLFQKKLKIKFTGASRPSETEINRINTDKMKLKLNWLPQTSLNQGLAAIKKTLKKQ